MTALLLLAALVCWAETGCSFRDLLRDPDGTRVVHAATMLASVWFGALFAALAVGPYAARAAVAVFWLAVP